MVKQLMQIATWLLINENLTTCVSIEPQSFFIKLIADCSFSWSVLSQII